MAAPVLAQHVGEGERVEEIHAAMVSEAAIRTRTQ
jgi:hypothetical protein